MFLPPPTRRGEILNNEPPKANEELGLDVSHEEDGKAVVSAELLFFLFPIPSMYDIFTYIWLIFMVNVGKYPIHGSYGFGNGIRLPKSNIDLDTNNDVFVCLTSLRMKPGPEIYIECLELFLDI